MEGIVSAILNQPADMPTSYGVEIPNTDGRAGMIAIPVKDEAEVNLDKLHAGVVEQLPKYARPMFVRIIKEVQMTSEGIFCSGILINIAATLSSQALTSSRRTCCKMRDST